MGSLHPKAITATEIRCVHITRVFATIKEGEKSTMTIIVRHIQNYRPEDWDKALETAKKWLPIGKRLGIPKDNFRRYISGAGGLYTLVNEREYDSMEAWEAAVGKMMGDPENQALNNDQTPSVEDWHIEILMPIDLE